MLAIAVPPAQSDGSITWNGLRGTSGLRPDLQ